jgi:hypothetical protein
MPGGAFCGGLRSIQQSLLHRPGPGPCLAWPYSPALSLELSLLGL